jgi:hypothetical protein
VFLQSLVKDAATFLANIGITNQLNDVSQDEKAYQKLLDEQSDLQKKKSGIEQAK